MRRRNMNIKSTSSLAILLLCLFVLFGCAGTATLNLNYHPGAAQDTLLASVSPMKIKLSGFEDKRKKKAESILIGGRHAAFGVPMGDVYSDRPVFEIIRDAVKSELTRNGHVIVDADEDVLIRGQIETFWVETDVTPLYWDIIGKVSISVNIEGRKRSSLKLGPYSAQNVERTYLNPSKRLMEKVLGKSLNEVIQKMSSDKALIKSLKVN